MIFLESLNDQNQSLYDSLISIGIKINFSVDEELTCWQVEEPMLFNIASHNAEPNESSLAHELLHIKLRSMGFWRTIDIYRFLNEKNSIFNADFLGKLDNQLGHFKMIDEFIEMGYNVDSFLQDTPKDYLLSGMILKAPLLVLQNISGQFEICEQTREIINLICGAKLFELYKIKDPTTINGVHSDIIINPLKKINKDLVDELIALFDEWYNTYTYDNMCFYYKLDELIKKYKITNLNKN
ncbi:hypothetical protein [Empedobacter brevis]